MYTLKGVFPEPKKPHKKNFVRDNVKQVKSMQQGKAQNDQNMNLKLGRDSRVSENLPSVKSSASNKSGKPLQVTKTSSSAMRAKKSPEIRMKKGNMAEFLKRKELRQLKGPPVKSKVEDTSTSEAESTCRLKDVGCQTIESNLSQQLADQRLTVPHDGYEGKQNASGDSSACRNRPMSPSSRLQNAKGDEEHFENEKKKKVQPVDPNKDPYLPSSYQKGVLPRYLRERREDIAAAPELHDSECPPGHVTLPDIERKETLRMLRTSFAELVSELNKMPVRTDTLRMRARKMELEKQLAKLEEGIKVFSRPKVFVRIGE